MLSDVRNVKAEVINALMCHKLSKANGRNLTRPMCGAIIQWPPMQLSTCAAMISYWVLHSSSELNTCASHHATHALHVPLTSQLLFALRDPSPPPLLPHTKRYWSFSQHFPFSCFCCFFVAILGQFWLHFVTILEPFCAYLDKCLLQLLYLLCLHFCYFFNWFFPRPGGLHAAL